MWIIQTILIHFFFLGSIFVMYFRSPIIKGLTPQNDIENPPAKRLVLMVTDGLRAESFFKEDCKHVPNIRRIFSERGIVGVSQTRVPTESRPGHIALIAGFYEDPSAVTRGWKENPIDFDSVFNRSGKTFAWGSHDILSIFSQCTDKKKLNIFSYDHALDFSGKDKTYLLDTWVFSRLKAFIERKFRRLRDESKVIFFLHLLGLDTSGHVHKPQSSLFLENLNITDHGILETYKLFEETFNDNRTAYVLTSDHGMTNAGSHGSGDDHETQTPFVVWGAGIKNWQNMNTVSSKKNMACNVPIFKIEQADIAPLMSSLIGVASPMNNFGILPVEFLNVSKEYLASAFSNNALQILSQYDWLLSNFKQGYFSNYLPEFYKFNLKDFTLFRDNLYRNMSLLHYEDVMKSCKSVLPLTLEGIDYYQNYFEKLLLFCTTLSFFGWIAYLFCLLHKLEIQNNSKINRIYSLAFVSIFLILLFVYLQNIPYVVGAYIIFPVFCWLPALSRDVFKHLQLSMTSIRSTAIFVIGAVLLSKLKQYEIPKQFREYLKVLSFYRREVISIAFVTFSFYEAKPFAGDSAFQQYKWIITTLLLATFPFYPSAHGAKSDVLMFLGVTLWLVKAYFNRLFMDRLCCIFTISVVANLMLCIYTSNNFMGVPLLLLMVSWILAVASYVLPLLTNSISQIRLKSIFHYFEATYMLLSVSYEFLFIVLLGIHLNMLTDFRKKSTDKNKYSKTPINILTQFKIAFSVLLFTMLSFFGTGNIASISSFDPTIVRCFVTTFSPFTIMSLVILKLTIPIVLIMCGVCEYTKSKWDEKRVFISILVICEVMGLSFLFMVTNKGSWLEIGTSISHFVIMEVTTLILLIINYVSKWLTTSKLETIEHYFSRNLKY